MSSTAARSQLSVREGTSDDDAICGHIVGAAASGAIYAPRLPHAAGLLADVSPVELGGRSRMVAVIAGHVIGFADYRAKDGHIKYLFVHPHAQGTGAGKALVDAVQERVAGSISVNVLAVNDQGILWYLRRGFVVTGGWEEPFEGVPAAWLRMERRPD